MLLGTGETHRVLHPSMISWDMVLFVGDEEDCRSGDGYENEFLV